MSAWAKVQGGWPWRTAVWCSPWGSGRLLCRRKGLEDGLGCVGAWDFALVRDDGTGVAAASGPRHVRPAVALSCAEGWAKWPTPMGPGVPT